MPWQYLPRLCMLFYIISRLGSIRLGSACYLISYHALAVSTIAQHAIAISCYWIVQLFYVLSRLGSILQGLVCNSISYHACILRLGTLSQGLACYSVCYHAMAVSKGLQGLACCSVIFYHALAVSSKAWHAILGMLSEACFNRHRREGEWSVLYRNANEAGVVRGWPAVTRRDQPHSPGQPSLAAALVTRSCLLSVTLHCQRQSPQPESLNAACRHSQRPVVIYHGL